MFAGRKRGPIRCTRVVPHPPPGVGKNSRPRSCLGESVARNRATLGSPSTTVNGRRGRASSAYADTVGALRSTRCGRTSPQLCVQQFFKNNPYRQQSSDLLFFKTHLYHRSWPERFQEEAINTLANFSCLLDHERNNIVTA